MVAKGYDFPASPTSGSVPNDLKDAASNGWVRGIAAVVNKLLLGKTNNVATITLTPNVATTALRDPRIGAFSAILLQPLTTHAAADLYSATSVLVDTTTQADGFVNFKHPNNANADKTFNVVIIG